MKSKIAGVFGLRLTYAALTFLTSILLARLLGKSGLGTYTYSVGWAYLLSVPATMGFDNFVVREIAVYRVQSAWGLMKGLLKWADRTVLIASVAIALLAMLIASFIQGDVSSDKFTGFYIAMMLMPALSLRNVRRGAMRGLNHITTGLLPELLFDPLILIGSTLAAYAAIGEALTPLWVIAFYGAGSGITLFIVSQFLKRTLPEQTLKAQSEYKGKFWFSAALPFMLLESIPILNSQIDVLMIGSFKGLAEVGLYSPVNRGAQLITFILMAVSSSLAPTVASRYANGELGKLQKTITSGVRTVAGVALLFALSLGIGSYWYLSLFGPEFTEGQNALYIFCAGNFLYTSLGLSYMTLNMTGHERAAVVIGWGAMTVNVVLNILLIPRWGIEGAALATSIGSTLGALVGVMVVKRKLGIDATVLGFFSDLPKPKRS